jgi:phosphoglycerate dehydrogenase-like enzyme
VTQPPAVVTVLCSDPADRPPQLASRLGAEAQVRTVYDVAELAAALPESDVVFVWDFRSSGLREAWSERSTVRWVHVASAGVDALLFPELQDRPVLLTNSRGVFDAAIAEFVLGAMLASAKDLWGTLRLQADHVWQHRESRLVRGATVVVVGAGSIGSAVAHLLNAVGCITVGVARTAREDPVFARIVAFGELGGELSRADYAVVTAPLTDETKGLIGARAFEQMNPGAVLINVGRGPIVDETALLAALDRGALRAAVLDVFCTEPLPPDHPFWARTDVVVSPHMCGDYEGFADTLVDLFANNFARWRSGTPWGNVVDKERGY